MDSKDSLRFMTEPEIEHPVNARTLLEIAPVGKIPRVTYERTNIWTGIAEPQRQ